MRFPKMDYLTFLLAVLHVYKGKDNVFIKEKKKITPFSILQCDLFRIYNAFQLA